MPVKKKKKSVVKKNSVIKKKKTVKARKAAAARPKKTAGRAKAKAAAPELGLEKVGEVTHYFPKVKAAAVLVLKDGLKPGDSVYIKGHTTNFKQTLTSMQLEHIPIQEAKKAQEIGVLVKSRVRIGDIVYKI